MNRSEEQERERSKAMPLTTAARIPMPRRTVQRLQFRRTQPPLCLLCYILLLLLLVLKYSDAATCSPDSPLQAMLPCNGHGECNQAFGLCVCDEGWNGFNCSEPDTPCGGDVSLNIPAGSFTDGFLGENYADNLRCTWYISAEGMLGGENFVFPVVLVPIPATILQVHYPISDTKLAYADTRPSRRLRW
eukprot:590561-Rhodomonas_salina.1